MPNRDGTGPEGKGPKTGRGAGDCQADSRNGSAPARGTGLGRGGAAGRGQGRGGGKGRGNRS